MGNQILNINQIFGNQMQNFGVQISTIGINIFDISIQLQNFQMNNNFGE